MRASGRGRREGTGEQVRWSEGGGVNAGGKEEEEEEEEASPL